MKKLLILLFIVTSFSAEAQKLEGQARVDSLIKALPLITNDTFRTSTTCNIGFAYKKINKDSAIYYVTKCRRHAIEKGYKGIVQWSAGFLGDLANKDGRYDDALYYYKQKKQFHQQHGDSGKAAYMYAMISDVFRDKNMVDSAIIYSDSGLIYLTDKKKIADKLRYTAGLYGMANISSAVSMERCLKAAEIYEGLGLDYEKALVYKQIMSIYSGLGKDSIATTYAEKALPIFLENIDKDGVEFYINGIANFYVGQKNYEKALELYQWDLDRVTKNKDSAGIAYRYIDIGNVFTKQAKYKEAHEKFLAAYDLAKDSDDEWLQYQKVAYLANSYNNLGEYKKALKFSQEALKMSEKRNLINHIALDYDELVNIYEGMGNYKKAFEYLKKSNELYDSIENSRNKDDVVRLETRVLYEKRMTADSLQKVKEQELAAQKLSRQRRYTFAGVGGVLLLIVIAFFIAKERRKSDKLLLNILPSEVAKELKAKGASDARLFDNVTVLFTDFVGFTTVSERLTPQELVHELDECFKAFDGIIGKYGMEKIKTIGDAYLAVCGLPTPDEQHAEKVVSAAREIRNFMVDRHTKLGDKTFEVRVGVHSGDVVAGIVGVKKFAYDIWGDTVNTAARMEQNSEAGKINISQTTYELVKDKFTCAYRGELEAKNKGKLKMYFVEA